MDGFTKHIRKANFLLFLFTGRTIKFMYEIYANVVRETIHTNIVFVKRPLNYYRRSYLLTGNHFACVFSNNNCPLFDLDFIPGFFHLSFFIKTWKKNAYVPIYWVFSSHLVLNDLRRAQRGHTQKPMLVLTLRSAFSTCTKKKLLKI